MFVIFGQLNTMRQKSSNSSILIAMIRFNRQTEFVVNTCVTAPIYSISLILLLATEPVCCYRETILSNLFFQGIISNFSW